MVVASIYAAENDSCMGIEAALFRVSPLTMFLAASLVVHRYKHIPQQDDLKINLGCLRSLKGSYQKMNF